MSFDNQRQQKELRAFAFDCPDCGETHIGANSFGYDRPAQCADVPISERRRRITLTNDLCRIAPGQYSENCEPQLLFARLWKFQFTGLTRHFPGAFGLRSHDPHLSVTLIPSQTISPKTEVLVG